MKIPVKIWVKILVYVKDLTVLVYFTTLDLCFQVYAGKPCALLALGQAGRQVLPQANVYRSHEGNGTQELFFKNRTLALAQEYQVHVQTT